jgi:hypothetical protein
MGPCRHSQVDPRRNKPLSLTEAPPSALQRSLAEGYQGPKPLARLVSVIVVGFGRQGDELVSVFNDEWMKSARVEKL